MAVRHRQHCLSFAGMMNLKNNLRYVQKPQPLTPSIITQSSRCQASCITTTIQLQAVVAPIALPSAGIKKLLTAIFPSLPLFPLTSNVSMLLKLLFPQVFVPSQEFPLLVCEPEKLVSPPTFAAAMLLFSTLLTVDSFQPVLPLFHAVLRVNVKFPVCELSVKPTAALEKAKQLVMLWFAGPMSPALPPPSLKPLPSPWKSVNPQRLKPLE